jgi:hypothetical protein
VHEKKSYTSNYAVAFVYIGSPEAWHITDTYSRLHWFTPPPFGEMHTKNYIPVANRSKSAVEKCKFSFQSLNRTHKALSLLKNVLVDKARSVIKAELSTDTSLSQYNNVNSGAIVELLDNCT